MMASTLARRAPGLPGLSMRPWGRSVPSKVQPKSSLRSLKGGNSTGSIIWPKAASERFSTGLRYFSATSKALYIRSTVS